MLKHIVMWKLKENAEGNSKTENAEKIKRDLEALVGQIEVIRHLEVGININETSQNYDVVLVSEFDNMDDLSKYANDERHLKIVKYIKKVVESRIASDYII